MRAKIKNSKDNNELINEKFKLYQNYEGLTKMYQCVLKR